MNITFEPLKEHHLPLILQWLETSHVKEWWDSDIIYTIDLVKEYFGKHIHKISLSNQLNKITYAYIITLNKEKIGYIQAYNARAWVEKKDLDLNSFTGPICGVDLFIGEPDYLYKGIGHLILTEMINQIVAPHFKWCLIDPSSNNKRAIKSFEKAGFKVAAISSEKQTIWMVKYISNSTSENN